MSGSKDAGLSTPKKECGRVVGRVTLSDIMSESTIRRIRVANERANDLLLKDRISQMRVWGSSDGIVSQSRA